MLRLPLLFFALLLTACPANPQPSPPTPKEPLDKSPDNAADCAAAEDRLITLKCKDGDGRLIGGPNKNNDPFHAVCENSMANHDDMNPKCLAAIKACSEINSCLR